MNDSDTIQCGLDEHGIRRIFLPDSLNFVGNFVESDVQASSKTCDELIKACSNSTEGQAPYERTGNAFTIIIRNGICDIKCLWDESVQGQISAADMVEILSAWKCGLQTP